MPVFQGCYILLGKCFIYLGIPFELQINSSINQRSDSVVG